MLFLVLTVLAVFIDLSYGQNTWVPPSPCPEYFQYQHGDSGWHGVISLRGPGPSDTIIISLNVTLSLRAQLQSVSIV